MNYENEILGCAYNCPAQDRKRDCPFNEVASQSFKEKVNWWKGLCKEKKESIIQHHIFCTENRMRK